MKSTLYTNCVLTVIAASLLYLCATHVAQPPSVQAAGYSVPTIKDNNGAEAVPVVVYSMQNSSGLGFILVPKQ
jgi:hypothetical protein